MTATRPARPVVQPATRETTGRPSVPRVSAPPGQGLGSVPREAWDRLAAPGSVPLRHGFLTAWERAELPGLRSRPLLELSPATGAPSAACPGYLYDLDLPTVRLPQLATMLAPVRRVWPRLGLLRTYEVGSPTPLVDPFLVADERHRDRALPRLVESAVATGREEGAALILVQALTERAGTAARALAAQGFAEVPGPPSAVLPLSYSSFDEYLGAMRAQYRRRAQKTLERSSHLSVERLDRFDHLADELARLWRCIYDRAREVRREILTPAVFAGWSELDEVFVLLTRRPDRSIASFAVLIDDRPWLSFSQCGFEERARQEGAYFRLLYEIVRLAIDEGYVQVDLGITTLAPKLDVGAVPVSLWAWLRHRHDAVQAIVRRAVQRWVRPPDLAPRRVFKAPLPSAEEILAQRRRA